MVKIIHNIVDNPLIKNKRFLVISCFGNLHNFIKNNGGEYTPNILINSNKVEKLKSIGMIDYVNVFCDDITPEQAEEIHTKHPGEYLIKLYSENNAKDVIKFIEKYKDEDCILISHCDAGVSRSSAHAQFVSEMVGIDFERLRARYPYIQPNPHILKTLRAEKAKNNK